MLRIFVAALAVALFIVGGAVAKGDKGARHINLDGGNRGIVPFPHNQHQTTLKNCQVCHTLFPQEKGGIERLKKEGKLTQKQVMNKHCIKCHKSTKRSGDKSGPTKCGECHVKNKS
jgi:hypothetical protein